RSTQQKAWVAVRHRLEHGRSLARVGDEFGFDLAHHQRMIRKAEHDVRATDHLECKAPVPGRDFEPAFAVEPSAEVHLELEGHRSSRYSRFRVRNNVCRYTI